MSSFLDSPPETAAASRQRFLGADVVRRTPDWTVMRDPAGRGNCTTGCTPGEV